MAVRPSRKVQGGPPIDLVFVRADRGLSLGLFIDALSPFDKQLRAALTAKQVRCLSAGLG